MSMNHTFSNSTIDLDRFEPREVISAAPDYLAHAFGQAHEGRALHPLAHSLDLPTICYAFAVANGAKAGPAGGAATRGPVMVSQGASTSGFIDLFRKATAPVILRAYQAVAQRSFAATLDLPDFKSQPIYSFDVAHGLDLVPESARIPRRRAFAANAGYATAVMQSYGQIFELNRDDLLSNDTRSLMNLLHGAGALAAQVETGLLAAVVESDPQLSDGAVFDASNSVGQALSAEGLGLAVGLLRNQGAPGKPLNIAPRHLVVDPGLEMLARKLVRDVDLSGTLQVSALPGLAAGRWLVLGDPDLIPSLTLVTLEGSGVSYQVQRSFKNDGVDISAMVNAGAMFAGRIGIVRGGV